MEAAWRQRRILWLSGVRRIGKTSLAQQIRDAIYFNCDRPSVRREMDDPEFFLANAPPNSTLVLDEVHRLANPTELLKLAADEYPSIRILATGSSSLSATKAFSDTLTGRKVAMHLTPVLWRERDTFGIATLDDRLFRGGFPETVLGKADRGTFFGEWMDSYYARDIVELFRIRDPSGYLRLVEILFRRSTGQLETTDLAKESGLSRPTVDSYLAAMEMSHVIFRLRPFHGGGTREIVRQPKVYGFDTGFVCWVRGWDEVTPEVRGRLWEHLVLDELRCSVEDRRLRYWRDKSGREIDFVVDRGNGVVDTIEAKINPERVDHKNLEAFRALYPDGSDYVAVPFCERPRALKIANRRVIVNEPARIPTE
jgi:uncharacterized protein